MNVATTMNEYIKAPMPKVNILKIRKLLETNYKVDHDLAEGIAEAIDTALQDQDTDGFATKTDIKNLEMEIHYMEYRLLFRLGLGLGTLMISIGTGLAWYVQFLMGRH
jgi:hypothetical protein